MPQIKYSQDGLVPCVVQDIDTKQVLMVAYMNEESLQKTIETGQTWFWSRSRGELWNKGATSGNTQKVEQIRIDCDGDCLLVFVKQTGAACHTGNKSCFYRTYDGHVVEDFDDASILKELFEVIEDRKVNPKEDSYTNYLFDAGVDKILKKVGEECAETIIAAKNDEPDEIALETADLIYHLLVMLSNAGMRLEDVYEELKNRR